MRDRRARLGMLLLILSFPVLIDALTPGHFISAGASVSAFQSTAALLGIGPGQRVELAEVIVVVGLMYAGWQRRRLLIAH